MVCDGASVTGNVWWVEYTLFCVGLWLGLQGNGIWGWQLMHSASLGTPSPVAVLELPRARWAVVLLVMVYAKGIATQQRNPPSCS